MTCEVLRGMYFSGQGGLFGAVYPMLIAINFMNVSLKSSLPNTGPSVAVLPFGLGGKSHRRFPSIPIGTSLHSSARHSLMNDHDDPFRVVSAPHMLRAISHSQHNSVVDPN